MLLTEKVNQLERDSVIAGRVAEFWQKQIELYGETKATEFYKSLGLNHLETKSKVEWEGLTLSREPNEVEKLCVKSIASAQDAGKASVSAVLMKARTELISEALKAIKKLTPATYHEMILTVPDKVTSELRDQLGKVFMKGKRLVATELGAQGSKSCVVCGATDHKQMPSPLPGGFKVTLCDKMPPNELLSVDTNAFVTTKQAQPTEEDDSELDDLTDVTNGRVANEVQARIAASAARFAALGYTGKKLWDAVEKEVGGGSTGWLDKIATGATNNVLNFGRMREAEDRKDEWGSVEFSSILDANLCDECAPFDGETATSEDDLEPVPVASCLGGDYCRCFHVFILDTVA